MNKLHEPDEYLHSWYDFDDDAQVDEDDYQACMRTRYCRLAPATIAAATAYGLDLDEETGERWKRIGVAAGLLDTVLDDAPVAQRGWAKGLYQQNVDYISGQADRPEAPVWAESLVEPAVSLVRNAVQPLPEHKTVQILEAAERIGQISSLKAACTGVTAYVRLLREEGALSGELITAAASERVSSQAPYRGFAAFFEQTMAMATLVDSARDLPLDYGQETTGVEPTRYNRGRLIARSAAAAVWTVRSPARLRTLYAGVRARFE